MLNYISSLSWWVKYYRMSKSVSLRCAILHNLASLCTYRFQCCVKYYRVSRSVSQRCAIAHNLSDVLYRQIYHKRSIRRLGSLRTWKVITAAVLKVPNLNAFKSNYSAKNLHITRPAHFWDAMNYHLCAFWEGGGKYRRSSLNRPQLTASKLLNGFQYNLIWPHKHNFVNPFWWIILGRTPVLILRWSQTFWGFSLSSSTANNDRRHKSSKRSKSTPDKVDCAKKTLLLPAVVNASNLMVWCFHCGLV